VKREKILVPKEKIIEMVAEKMSRGIEENMKKQGFTVKVVDIEWGPDGFIVWVMK